VGLSATVKGTYIVTVKAVASGEIYSYVSGKKKTINIYSSPSYASVTQLFGTTKTHVEPDTYEQDDTFDRQASWS